MKSMGRSVARPRNRVQNRHLLERTRGLLGFGADASRVLAVCSMAWKAGLATAAVRLL
jgi:hypothetical protein